MSDPFAWMCGYEERWTDDGRLRPEFRTRRASFTGGTRSMIVALLTDRDGPCCVGCGRTTRLHIDHIRPLARGGGNQLWNLQLLCERCNLRKGAR